MNELMLRRDIPFRGVVTQEQEGEEFTNIVLDNLHLHIRHSHRHCHTLVLDSVV